MNWIEKFDNSGRKPRKIQEHVMGWIEEAVKGKKVLAISAPCGVGKSAILRALQLNFPGNNVGLVPTNQLLDQYIETYPTINYIKGIHHYQCSVNEGFTCQEAKEMKMPPCDSTCMYKQHKKRAEEGESTIFNPISYFYQQENVPPADVLIVDEAHKLADTLMLLTGTSFRKGYYKYPKIENDIQLLDWLQSTVEKLSTAKKELQKKNEIKEALTLHRQMEKIYKIITGLKKSPQNFVYYTQMEEYRKKKEEYLYVLPVHPPPWLLKQILACNTLVLMSATLLQHDVWDLGIQDFAYLDVPSPIPKENRPVLYSPAKVPFDYKTEPVVIANWIKEVLAKYPDRNTIVHLSYGWARRLAEFFPNALTHTSETKNEALATFKAKGGVWLAAGCAEGIDLPGDECRLNIIPIIMRGNPMDPVTKKQVAMPRGWLKYELKALTTLIQQVGRSTRGVDDHSISVVGDSRFPQLISKNRQYIPNSFLESIKWGGK